MKRSASVLLVAAMLVVSCVGGGGTGDGRADDRDAAAAAPSADDEVRLEMIRGRLDSALGETERDVAVDALTEEVWLLRDGTRLDIVNGVPWAGWRDATTSQLRLLHSLLLVHDLVAAEQPRHRETALELVGQWAEANPRAAPAHAMAWHDETTARRTSALVRLHDAFSRHPRSDEGGTRRERLRTLIGEHLELLLDDEFHATGTNHGMFQDRSALIAAAYLEARSGPTPQTERAWSIASERLVEYYRTSISDDGVHREHAPAYHQVIAAAALRDGEFLTSFGATDAGRVLTEAHADMVGYATHVIQPDGTWPLVSDTFRDQYPQVSLWDDPAYRFAATGGRDGTPPTEPAAAFEDAGYVVMRDRWTADGRATYLHFTAAYHTDYHKHADDLSLWLYHDGPLLTELGPQGYTMDDPLVQCAYSDDAHNIATVEGLDLPRVDDRIGHTRLLSSDLDGDVWSATGVNERLDGATFERDVRYDADNATVEVRDRVRTDQSRAVRVRWHLDPTVAATVADGGDAVTLARSGLDPVTATFRSSAPFELEVLGPDPRGCAGISFGGDEPVPSSTLDVRIQPGRETELVSRFVLP